MADSVNNATEQLIVELANQGTKLVAAIGSGLALIVTALVGLSVYYVSSRRQELELRNQSVLLHKENNEIKKALSPKSSSSSM
jgi:hypothetical protein